MPTNYGKHFSPQSTPQSQPLPGREAEMKRNAAGGFTFQLDDWTRLRRFLILGCEGGSYYASEQKLTIENAQCAMRCIAADGVRVVDIAVDISDRALAPKNDPAIFILALVSVKGNIAAKQHAFRALPKICRIATHLFTFCEYRQALGGGWGDGMKRAIERWYTLQHPTVLINQALKYQQRNGWSHRDLLRLAHPHSPNPVIKKTFDAICRPEKWEALRSEYSLVEGWLKLHAGVKDASGITAWSPVAAAKIISDYQLPRELVPTELLTSAVVWEALLPHMGYTALLRNLGNLSKCGLLKPLSSASGYVHNVLTNAVKINSARIHPWAVLLAASTYGSGKGFRGKGEWLVDPAVVNALNTAFQLSFHNVVPTGKRFLLGLDVSGSMASPIGDSNISSAEAAAAMAFITIQTEPLCYTFGFSTEFRDLRISKSDSLSTILTKTQRMAFGGTDCAVPIRFARERGIEADVVMIYTDNETWHGPRHATSELELYRRATGIPLKLGCVGFTATADSIADPIDAGSMNFVGLDASLPAAIHAFVSEGG